MFKSLFFLKYNFIFLLIFCGTRLYAIPPIVPGTPVYDATAVIHMMDIVKNTTEQIKYHKQMIENIGSGKITPASLNYLGDIYTSCVGKKFVIPDFMPRININICSSGSTDQIGTFYTDKILINRYDNEKTRQLKLQQLTTKRQQLRKSILTTSTSQIIYHANNNPKVIESLYNDLKTANTQVAVEKIQAQIQLKILEELQEIKINQALMMQSIGLTN